jgi:hypothetical protein
MERDRIVRVASHTLPSRGLSQDRARNRALATLSQLPARVQVPEQLMSMFWVLDSDDDNPASTAKTLITLVIHRCNFWLP